MNPKVRACKLTASAWKSWPEINRSTQTAATFESGGSRCGSPDRPATSHAPASVTREAILRVRAFIALFTADFFQNFVERSRIKGLLEAHCVFFQQSGFLEKFNAGVTAVFARAAVHVPNAQFLVGRRGGLDQFRLGFGQQPERDRKSTRLNSSHTDIS